LGTIDKKQLVEACQAGDREAQGLLYSTYRRKMMRIIRQYVPDCDMSQDVLHDGFLIILSQIQSLRNPEQLEYWMATIMKNLSLHSLSQIQFDDILEEPEEEVDEDPAQELSYEELMALVDQLPDGYRTVFRLAVLEGKSHQEIADMLGISPKSSASQLARAKEKLRALILEHRRQAAMLAVLALFLLPLSLYFVRHRQEVEIP
jgi:RNA polymerase sigma-70 factor (ECF subfamily)